MKVKPEPGAKPICKKLYTSSRQYREHFIGASELKEKLPGSLQPPPARTCEDMEFPKNVFLANKEHCGNQYPINKIFK